MHALKSPWDFNRPFWESHFPFYTGKSHYHFYLPPSPTYAALFTPCCTLLQVDFPLVSQIQAMGFPTISLSSLIFQSDYFCTKDSIADVCSVFSISQFHPPFPWTALKHFLSFLLVLYSPTPPTSRQPALPTELFAILNLEGRARHVSWHCVGAISRAEL